MIDYPIACYPIICIESPHASHPDALRYLACCILDSTLRNETPIASHAIFPLALPEHVEAYYGKTGRDIGLSRRDALAEACNDAGLGCVRYVDLGIFPAMNRPGRYQPDRKLQGEAKRVFDGGEWPTQARITRNH
jgi:hypothetical protein